MDDILDYLFEKSKPPIDASDLPDEKTVLDGHDAIRSLLTFPTWKGEPRELSQLTVLYQSPDWVARLSDYDNRRSCSATGKTVASAIESLNGLLLSGNPRWYCWPTRPGEARKKKPATSSGQNTG